MTNQPVKVMFKSGILFLFIVILVGCASQLPFEQVTYDDSASYRYPAISITLNDDYVESEFNCIDFACYTYQKNTQVLIANSLRNTKLFSRVDMNNAHAEYTLDIQYLEIGTDSDTAEISKLMLGAATFFVVPTVSDRVVQFTVAVRYKNQVIKHYNYREQYSKTQSFFTQREDYDRQLIDYFVSRLMRDLEQDRLLPPVVRPINQDPSELKV